MDTIAELRRLARREQVVAIGECGLDFNRDFSPRPQQEKWFEVQVALAEELQMPLFLHERDADQRFCEILTAVRKSVPAVVHCFTEINQVGLTRGRATGGSRFTAGNLAAGSLVVVRNPAPLPWLASRPGKVSAQERRDNAHIRL